MTTDKQFYQSLGDESTQPNSATTANTSQVLDQNEPETSTLDDLDNAKTIATMNLISADPIKAGSDFLV